MKKLDMIWRCWTRADLVNKKLLQQMFDAGCKEIAFGVESGSQKILDTLNKGITVEQNINAVKNAKKAGIYTKVFLMIGCPCVDNHHPQLHPYLSRVGPLAIRVVKLDNHQVEIRDDYQRLDADSRVVVRRIPDHLGDR